MKFDFMMRFKRTAIVSLFLSFISSGAMAQNQDAQVLYHQSLAATCANCHGTQGKGVQGAGMPLINQYSEKEMLAQLMAFRTGARTGTIMPQLMKGYTEEQLQIIASVLGKK